MFPIKTHNNIFFNERPLIRFPVCEKNPNFLLNLFAKKIDKKEKKTENLLHIKDIRKDKAR